MDLTVRPSESTSHVVTRWSPPPEGVAKPVGRFWNSTVRVVSTSTMLFKTAPVWASYCVCRFYVWHITGKNAERFAHPTTFRTSLCNVCRSAVARWPMTRMTSPCSMVLKTGLSNDALMSPAARQSSTMASP